ncbi:ABC transporter permease [Candidatus Woesearchaeota archaeon]|nr:ABC transporter permease [Candidatus Woesearchaeota archaeon]
MIGDLFFLSIKNLTHRRLRSYLTIIGILIGIAAVVALISLSEGMQKAIEQQFQEAGSNIIIVMSTSGGMSSPMLSLFSTKPLTEKDLRAVENLRGVDKAGGVLMMPAMISVGKEKKNIFLTGMDPGPIEEMVMNAQSYEIIEGRMLEEGDRYKALLGYSAAKDLFDRELHPGDKINIMGKTFRVVGIISKVGNRMDDESVTIPLDVMRDLIGEKEKLGMIILSVKDGYDVEEVAEEVREKLRKERNEEEGEETFVVSTPRDLLKIFQEILMIIQVVLIGVAAISLIVGGVGIMNTMYMAVMERTREIGIMKAIGAENSHILLIFLFESGILGMIGGICGVLIGLGISKGIEIAASIATGSPLIKAYISPELIIGSIIFSFIVGMISGVMPARQAARLKPVDALRYE